MTVNLLSPMQLRDNDLRVNDEPKYMVPNPTDSHHAINIPLIGDNEDDSLLIPLSLKGVTSYFPTRKPTRHEYENSPLSSRIDLTSESIEWDPTSEHFAAQEENMVDSEGKLKDKRVKWKHERAIYALHCNPNEPPMDSTFGAALPGTCEFDTQQKKKDMQV